jgi:hypothetical protein
MDDGADFPEVEALLRAADWRMRKHDADPSDDASLRAARQLEKLAAELRVLGGSDLFGQYVAMANWLGESDGISEFEMRAEYFRERLGFGTWAEDGEGYLRALIEMARETAGLG